MRSLLFASVFFWVTFVTNSAIAATFNIEDDLVGDALHYTFRKGEELFGITRAADLGMVEFLAANPRLDPENPQAGMRLILPKERVLPDAPREGIVINLAEMRLYYFTSPQEVVTYPVSIGRMGWETKTGSTTIVRKREKPIWTPPASIRAENPDLPAFIPAGPDNPLGNYAMNLGWENFIIHGTSNPKSIGRRLSHGCIRLYPEDIEALYNLVPLGTRVTVVDQPYKLGWRDDTLYLEITPLQPGRDAAVAAKRNLAPGDIPGLVAALEALESGGVEIDWGTVKSTAAYHNGRPTGIATRQQAGL